MSSELRDRRNYVPLEADPKLSPELENETEEDTLNEFVFPPEYVGTLQEKIFSFCEYNKSSAFLKSDPRLMLLSFCYQATSIILILLNTVIFIVTTEPEYHDKFPVWSVVIDVIVVVFFTIDWVLRLVCAPSKPKFLTNTFNIFDFLSFAPTYIEWIAHSQGSSIAMLRFLRLFRVFRLFRLVRFSATLKIAIQSMINSQEGFILLVMVIVVNLVFFSTMVYFAEGVHSWFDTETEEWKYIGSNVTSPFQSITSTFWWNIVSITTVGYGDVVPKTPTGKFVASIALVSGIILLAFPIAIFGTNFHTMYTEWKEKERKRHQENKEDFANKSKVQKLLVLSSEVYQLHQKLKELHEQIEECHTKIKNNLDVMSQIANGELLRSAAVRAELTL